MKVAPIYLMLLTIAIPGFTQHATQSLEDKHEFKRFRISVNIGHCYIPKAEFSNDEQLIVLPTWGLDFQYWFSEKIGIGLKNDVENASYRVRYRSNSSDLLIRERPVIISMPVFYKPWDNGLALMLGPGIELEENSNLFVFRIGVAYDFELGRHWDFAPEIVYDHKGTSIGAYTIAISV
jgi:hypothetical protein